MKPYFEAHPPAGFLLLVIVLGWLAMEYHQSRQRRDAATTVAMSGWRVITLACALVSDVMLYLAPRIAPGAAIHPGAVAFAAGIVILLGGIALRGWAFRTLGGYFTFTVMVSADQPVVSTGPYRLLRHPSYSALLLICAGLGLTSANWPGLAFMTVPPLVIITCAFGWKRKHCW